MLITDSFRVDLPIDEAWQVLLDVERIAPCMPGAELTSVEGDEFRGTVKVKVGPITAQYRGTAAFQEVDEPGRRVVIEAKGRDVRGQGNASAVVTSRLSPDGDGTVVTIESEVRVTGKVAQLGRGVMQDVSSKILAEFVDRLEREVLGPAPESEVVDEAVPRHDVARPGNEPLDLLGVGAWPVIRRALPAVLGVGAVTWLLRRLFRR